MAGAPKKKKNGQHRADKQKKVFQVAMGIVLATMGMVDASPLTKGDSIPIEVYLLVVSVMIGIRPEGLLTRK